MYQITDNIIDGIGRLTRKMKRPKGAISFRLLDDDGNVYFKGWTTDLNEEADKAFAPLDEVGDGYGCTSLEYRENGEWEVL